MQAPGCILQELREENASILRKQALWCLEALYCLTLRLSCREENEEIFLAPKKRRGSLIILYTKETFLPLSLSIYLDCTKKEQLR